MEIGKYRILKTALLVLLVCTAIASNVYSAPRINYRGLRSGKALIDINERMVELTPGQSFRNIVTLLSVNEEEIVLEVEGKRYHYEKNSSRGTILAEEVMLTLGPYGSYRAKGKVNGKDVTFVVDTGANKVILNKVLARALEIELGNKEVIIATASKIETGYEVTLDNVSVGVGGIELQNILAIITKHTSPLEPLLGMSFLQHVDISQENEQMTLKYEPR
jgi:aspartyl protease family protein